MNREDIKNYLSDPGSLDKKAGLALKEIIGSFPYYSLLYLLLARSYKNEGNPALEDVTGKAAAYSPDREGLYLFLHAQGKKTTDTAAPEPALTAETAAAGLSTPTGTPDPRIASAKPLETTESKPETTEATRRETAPPKPETTETQETAEAKPETTEAELQETAPPDPQTAEAELQETAEPKPEAPSPKPETTEPVSQEDTAAPEIKPGQAGQLKDTDDETAPKPLAAPTGTSLEKRAAGPRDIALNIDDQVPRTFTFWLRRVRQVTSKEPHTSLNISDALEKNYYQELITRNNEKEYVNRAGVEFDLEKKEDRIIARFIEEDPQVIKPSLTIQAKEPAANAPAGSDEEDEVVSETLAKIYIDQNLTGKAIRMYEKLSLKFPEKSAYFAGLVEKLKK